MRAVRALIARTVRATTILVRDGRIPKPLRWLAALALLPIPGPFDEGLLLVIVPILLVLYRTPVHEAWHTAGQTPAATARRGPVG